MKLHQLLEVRYAGPTNTYVIAWPNNDWEPTSNEASTWYAFGTTQARKGYYIRSDQFVAVESGRGKAKKTKDTMESWEQGLLDADELRYGERKNISQQHLDEISQSLERGELGGWDYLTSFVDFMMAKS